MRISDWSSDVCSSDLPQRDRGGQEDGDRGARPSDHRPWGARQPEVDGADLGVGAGAGLSARPVPATAPLAATPSLCDEAPPQLSAKDLPHGAALRPPRDVGYLDPRIALPHLVRSEEHTSELQSLMRI